MRDSSIGRPQKQQGPIWIVGSLVMLYSCLARGRDSSSVVASQNGQELGSPTLAPILCQHFFTRSGLDRVERVNDQTPELACT